MLGPMLATVHNLHYYLNLMAEMRAALDAGAFGEFVRRFSRRPRAWDLRACSASGACNARSRTRRAGVAG